MRFTLDGFVGTYEAVRFDRPWNGWAAPVVTGGELSRMVAAEAGDEVTMSVHFLAPEDGSAAILTDGGADRETVQTLLEPDVEGNYPLRALGWVFDRVDDR
ncbi:hypothetical protein [Tsukamurella spumae]|uniref:Uncharacterized protein n=1 Tax=Tsukamurella spumae TaxID=44753 RepID=A0A846X2S9_9ACTN|nr:hypothetical protein [Tsukamurella spumae]NKY19463.1 hypothetical protein [Tsukamurella spumae]